MRLGTDNAGSRGAFQDAMESWQTLSKRKPAGFKPGSYKKAVQKVPGLPGAMVERQRRIVGKGNLNLSGARNDAVPGASWKHSKASALVRVPTA